MKKLTCMGSGQYNFDIIVVREYTEPFVPGQRNPYVEKVVLEDIGGTCGNVMCMLARYGWHTLPQAQFIEDAEGLKLTKSLADWGCDVRYVENIPTGGLNACIAATGIQESMKWAYKDRDQTGAVSGRLSNFAQEMKCQNCFNVSIAYPMSIFLIHTKPVRARLPTNCD